MTLSLVGDLGNSNSSTNDGDDLATSMTNMSDSPSNSPSLRVLRDLGDTPEKKQSSLTPPPTTAGKKGLAGKKGKENRAFL